MSILFAIIAKKNAEKDSNKLINKVNKVFSGYQDGVLNTFLSDQCSIFHWDCNAYAQTSWLQTDSQIATLVGHPLLSCDRSQDLVALSKSAKPTSMLCQSEGAFCYLSYNITTNSLLVASDPLGVRPYYFLELPDCFIVTTKLSLLKQLDIKLEPCEAGLIEYATLGYYLLDHSPYRDVKCSYPGQFSMINSVTSQHINYFDWRVLAAKNISLERAVEGMKHAFSNVCDKYLANDIGVVATLSGGLDSRVIAAEIKQKNKQLVAFNFSTVESQDLACARMFAEQHDIIFKPIRVDDTQTHSVEHRLGQHWRAQPLSEKAIVTRPQLVWSGNGGSVGVGMVYYSQEIYQAAINNNQAEVIELYLQQQFAYLPASMIDNAKQLQQLLADNIALSLNKLAPLPLEKRFFLFLLLNDQHHHVAEPFEQIEQYQLEFCMPFFSWKVLQYTLGQPVENVLAHKFYMQWMESQYPEALTTPWQTYPQHLACPLPQPGVNQWQIAKNKVFKRSQLLAHWRHVMLYKGNQLINKTRFSLLCLAHLLHLKNTSTQLKMASKLTRW